MGEMKPGRRNHAESKAMRSKRRERGYSKDFQLGRSSTGLTMFVSFAGSASMTSFVFSAPSPDAVLRVLTPDALVCS